MDAERRCRSSTMKRGMNSAWVFLLDETNPG
jgi:hypothetical protein